MRTVKYGKGDKSTVFNIFNILKTAINTHSTTHDLYVLESTTNRFLTRNEGTILDNSPVLVSRHVLNNMRDGCATGMHDGSGHGPTIYLHTNLPAVDKSTTYFLPDDMVRLRATTKEQEIAKLTEGGIAIDGEKIDNFVLGCAAKSSDRSEDIRGPGQIDWGELYDSNGRYDARVTVWDKAIERQKWDRRQIKEEKKRQWEQDRQEKLVEQMMTDDDKGISKIVYANLTFASTYAKNGNYRPSGKFVKGGLAADFITNKQRTQRDELAQQYGKLTVQDEQILADILTKEEDGSINEFGNVVAYIDNNICSPTLRLYIAQIMHDYGYNKKWTVDSGSNINNNNDNNVMADVTIKIANSKYKKKQEKLKGTSGMDDLLAEIADKEAKIAKAMDAKSKEWADNVDKFYKDKNLYFTDKAQCDKFRKMLVNKAEALWDTGLPFPVVCDKDGNEVQADFEQNEDAQWGLATPYPMGPMDKVRMDFLIREAIREGRLIKLDKNHKLALHTSPAFLADRKGHLTKRMVVDYRKLNANMKTVAYRMPDAEQIFQKLQQKSNKFFNTMDLALGFNQMKLSERAMRYLAIVVSDGVYMPTRMPLGPAFCPAFFQQHTANTFGNAVDGVFIDDLIYGAETFDECYKKTETILDICIRTGFRLSMKKCKFGMDSCEVLGMQMTAGGRTVTKNKSDNLAAWPTPKTKGDIVSFLAFCNYVREFYADQIVFQKHRAILQDFCSGGVRGKPKFPMTDFDAKATESFNYLKTKLDTEVCIRKLDYNAARNWRQTGRPAVVCCDASYDGRSFVIGQAERAGGPIRPVMIRSKSFGKTERNWTVLEIELASIQLFLDSGIQMIQGLEAFLFFDHKNMGTVELESLMYNGKTAPKVARWIEKILNNLAKHATIYRMHINGVLNVLADATSRNPIATTANLTKTEQSIIDTLPCNARQVVRFLFDKNADNMTQDDIDAIRRKAVQELDAAEGNFVDDKWDADDICPAVEKALQPATGDATVKTKLAPVRVDSKIMDNRNDKGVIDPCVIIKANVQDAVTDRGDNVIVVSNINGKKATSYVTYSRTDKNGVKQPTEERCDGKVLKIDGKSRLMTKDRAQTIAKEKLALVYKAHTNISDKWHPDRFYVFPTPDKAPEKWLQNRMTIGDNPCNNAVVVNKSKFLYKCNCDEMKKWRADNDRQANDDKINAKTIQDMVEQEIASRPHVTDNKGRSRKARQKQSLAAKVQKAKTAADEPYSTRQKLRDDILDNADNYNQRKIDAADDAKAARLGEHLQFIRKGTTSAGVDDCTDLFKTDRMQLYKIADFRDNDKTKQEETILQLYKDAFGQMTDDVLTATVVAAEDKATFQVQNTLKRPQVVMVHKTETGVRITAGAAAQMLTVADTITFTTNTIGAIIFGRKAHDRQLTRQEKRQVLTSTEKMIVRNLQKQTMVMEMKIMDMLARYPGITDNKLIARLKTPAAATRAKLQEVKAHKYQYDDDNTIITKQDDKYFTVIPTGVYCGKNYRQKIVAFAHKKTGHGQYYATSQQLRQLGVWWLTMYKDTQNFFSKKKCRFCNEYFGIPAVAIEMTPEVVARFGDIFMFDNVGPWTVVTIDGIDYDTLLTVVDVATGFFWAIPIHSKNVKDTCKALEITFLEFKAPQELRADNGFSGITNVDRGQFAAWLDEMKAKHGWDIVFRPSTAIHPISQHHVERTHVVVRRIFAEANQSGDTWAAPQTIAKLNNVIRSTPIQARGGISPLEAIGIELSYDSIWTPILGRRAVVKAESAQQAADAYLDNYNNMIQDQRQKAIATADIKMETSKVRDLTRAKQHGARIDRPEGRVGAVVRLELPAADRKQKQGHKGNCTKDVFVVQAEMDRTVVLQTVDGDEITKFKNVVSKDRLIYTGTHRCDYMRPDMWVMTQRDEKIYKLTQIDTLRTKRQAKYTEVARTDNGSIIDAVPVGDNDDKLQWIDDFDNFLDKCIILKIQED